MFSPLTPAEKGFTPRNNAQLLRDLLEKSEAGSPGAPSVHEMIRVHRRWNALGKQTAKGAKYTFKY